MFTVDNFIRGITDTSRNLSAIIQEDSLVLIRDYYGMCEDERHQETIAIVPINSLEQLACNLSEDYISTDIILSKKTYMEVAVQVIDRNRSASLMRLDQGAFQINDHNYHFITSRWRRQ